MCIAHSGWCECEPVRIPTVGANESWRIMGNRFRFAHRKKVAVYNCNVIDNSSMVTGRKVYSGMAFNPPNNVSRVTGRMNVHRIQTPVQVMQRHISTLLPITRSKSRTSNWIERDPLFRPNGVNTQGNRLPYARH